MYLRRIEFMGTSEFHGTVDVRLDLFIRHMKSFIRTFCSLCETAHNESFFHKNLLKLQIEKDLRCYIELSTSTYIKNLLRIFTKFAYIL